MVGADKFVIHFLILFNPLLLISLDICRQFLKMLFLGFYLSQMERLLFLDWRLGEIFEALMLT